MADDDKQSQTVQIALMAQEIHTLTNTINSMRDDLRLIIDDHEARLRIIEPQLSKLQDRLTTWQIFTVIFTSAVGGVSAFFKRP